jgi:Transcriptional regulatory protein, C terminal
MPTSGEKVYAFEGFTFDHRRSSLHRAGREIELRPKSFDVLRKLLENARRLVPKGELLKAIWPNVFVSDESVSRCVSDIRRALGDEWGGARSGSRPSSAWLPHRDPAGSRGNVRPRATPVLRQPLPPRPFAGSDG